MKSFLRFLDFLSLDCFVRIEFSIAPVSLKSRNISILLAKFNPLAKFNLRTQFCSILGIVDSTNVGNNPTMDRLCRSKVGRDLNISFGWTLTLFMETKFTELSNLLLSYLDRILEYQPRD